MTDAVVVVGGGPAGLAAAIELRRAGIAPVVVLEREHDAGGVPRHTDHAGFGLRDLHRVLSGPRYAARYVELAASAGVDVRTETTVTAFSAAPDHEGTVLDVTSPAGRARLVASAVVLTTGCRERPRAARLVPGTRPLGIFTTGTLQQLVSLEHATVGRRAVVVGAEHVSFSAVLTLAHGGARTVAMVTDLPHHQTYGPFAWLAAGRHGVPILTSSTVTDVIGRRRLEAVEITDLRTGTARRIACDTLVFTGDWIPDHELARVAGLVMDRATRAPRVDGALRTSARAVFAAGNLVHAAETADVAALSGRHVAASVRSYLSDRRWPAAAPVPIVCRSPVRWISPSAVDVDRSPVPRGRFLLRVDAFVPDATLEIRQHDRLLSRRRFRRLVPARSIHADGAWIAAVDPNGGAIEVTITG